MNPDLTKLLNDWFADPSHAGLRPSHVAIEELAQKIDDIAHNNGFMFGYKVGFEAGKEFEIKEPSRG